jgi:Matrixin.
MKKKIILLTLAVMCLLVMSIANAENGISKSNGFSYDSYIRLSFNQGDFNTSEMSAINNGAAVWQNAGRTLNTSRKPTFYSYPTQYMDWEGISFRKSYQNTNWVGQCTYWWTSSAPNTNYKANVVFNTKYRWVTTPNPGSGYYDMQSVASHEIGHALGLTDLYSSSNRNAMMYTEARGQRTLSSVDLDNFKKIYGNAWIGKYLLADDEEYLSSEDLHLDDLSPSENFLYLRNIPAEDNKTYEIEIGQNLLFASLTDDEMITESDLIVKGRVKEISASQWDTPDGKAPSSENMLEYNLFHDVIVEVDEVYKGELTGRTQEITVRHPGGTLDNVRLTIDNIPGYYEDEDVVLYLTQATLSSGSRNTGMSLNSRSDNIIYYQLNEKGQIFVIDNELGVNGLGQKVNLLEIESSFE